MGMRSYPVECMSCNLVPSVNICDRCGKLLCKKCTVESYLPLCESCGWIIIDRSLRKTITRRYSQYKDKLTQFLDYNKWCFSAFEIYGVGITDHFMVEKAIVDGVFEDKSRPEQEAKVGDILWI